MSDWKKYSKTDNAASASTSNNSYKTAAIIMSILFVVATIAAISFSMKSNNFETQTSQLTKDLGELNTVKTELETDLAALNTDYDTKIKENGELQSTIEERIAEINTLQSKIRKVRKQLDASEANSVKMQERLTELEELKTALQTDVDNLKNENAQLVAAKAELNATLTSRESEIENLNGQIIALSGENQKLQNRLYNVAPAGYRANNFSIDIEKRNDKLTAKARKAREIKVNFDLPNIPNEKQGESEIYLVVTDVHGNAVKEVPSSPINVKAANEVLKVEAADIQKVNLEDSQSVTLSFEPKDKLDAGEYNLMVYSEHGYLGATAFRLR